jgi:hypothetical protein
MLYYSVTESLQGKRLQVCTLEYAWLGQGGVEVLTSPTKKRKHVSPRHQYLNEGALKIILKRIQYARHVQDWK